MARLYLETSIVSYLTAKPSGDLVTAAHQLITSEWWRTRRADFEIVTSELVLEEAARGDRDAAARRHGALQGLPLVAVTQEAAELAQAILQAHLLPRKAFADALHIAVSAVHGLDFLLTWNCAHIANAELLPRVSLLLAGAGFRPPFVCTPEELMGGRDVDQQDR